MVHLKNGVQQEETQNYEVTDDSDWVSVFLVLYFSAVGVPNISDVRKACTWYCTSQSSSQFMKDERSLYLQYKRFEVLGPSSLTSMNSNDKSCDDGSIKGGGRVALSSEIEDAIVDLLLERRDPKRPLLSRSKFSMGGKQASSTSSRVSSGHDDAHRRRIFLERLVTDHERHVLS